MTTEQMARMGTVGGESLKQIAVQGAEMVTFFGPTGAWVGALAVAGIALYEMFDRADEKMEESRRKFGEYLEQAVKTGDVKSITGSQRELLGGAGRFAQRKEDESDLDFRVRQIGLTAANAKLEAFKKTQREGVSSTGALTKAGSDATIAVQKWTAAIDKLDASYTQTLPALEAARKEAARIAAEESAADRAKRLPDLQRDVEEAFRAAIASSSPGKSDDTDAKIDALVAKAKEAGKSAAWIAAQVAKIRDGVREAAIAQDRALAADLEAAVQQLAGGQADAMQAANDKLVQQLQQRLDLETEITNATRAERQASIDRLAMEGTSTANTVRLLEQLARADKQASAGLADRAAKAQQLEERESQLLAVTQLSTTSNEARAAAERDLLVIRQQRIELASQLAAADRAEIERIQQVIAGLEALRAGVRTDKERQQFDERIAEYKKQQRDLQTDIVKLGSAELAIARERDATQKRDVQNLEHTARLIGDSVNGALELANAFGLVDEKTTRTLQNVGKIAAALPLAMAGDPGAIVSIIGSAAGLAKGLFGGDSAKEEAQRRALEENTRALQQVAAQAARGGLLGVVNASGTASATARDTLKYFLESGLGQKGGIRSDYLPFDVMETLNDWARRYNITLDGSREKYETLLKVLQQQIPLLGEFPAGFESTMQQLEASKRILGSQGPLGDLVAYIKSVAAYSPLVKGLLESLPADASQWSASDLASLKAAVQEFFRTMMTGADKLDPTQMGIANDAFLEFIETVVGSIDEIVGAVKSASERLAGALSDIDAELALYDVTDPASVFRRKAKGYAANVGGSLGELLAGLDLDATDPANLDAITAALQEFFERLRSSPETVDLAGLSIEELVRVLLELETAVDHVAETVAKSTQTITVAGADLEDTWAVHNTSSVDQIGQQAKAFNIDNFNFDLTTAAGREAAIRWLTGAFDSAITTEEAHKYRVLIDMIRRLSPIGGGAGSGGGLSRGAGGDPSASFVQDVRTITVEEGSKIGGTLAALLATETQFMTGTFARLDALLIALQPVTLSAPQMPFAALAGSGGPVNLTVHIAIYGNVGTLESSAAALTALVRRELFDELDRYLGIQTNTAAQLRGNVIQR
jgi:hypothetical protein